jgi:hypothetical protein
MFIFTFNLSQFLRINGKVLRQPGTVKEGAEFLRGVDEGKSPLFPFQTGVGGAENAEPDGVDALDLSQVHHEGTTAADNQRVKFLPEYGGRNLVKITGPNGDRGIQ